MKEAPIPSDETKRLLALAQLNILDTSPEERFDRITRLALHIFKVPISTLTLVDSDREWFKSCQGLPEKEGKRAISFCGHAMLSDGPFVIPDTKLDPRFSDNPMVVGPPHIRFYAGMPIRAMNGQRVGVFCIKDYEPRVLDEKQIDVLKALGAWAELELNFHELGRSSEQQQKIDGKKSDLNKILSLINITLRHDILGDLSVIKGSLSLLAETKNNRYIKASFLAIERSISLIETMRDLEAAVLTGTALKPHRVIDVVEKIRKGYPEINFSIKDNCAADCTVMADEAIYSMVENIIRNAKVHGKAKNVEIVMNDIGDRTEISIANDGNGLDPKTREHLFEDGFTFGKNGRTGLGLYIVRKTAERYGGTVRLEDNGPSGARFVFSLPRIK